AQAAHSQFSQAYELVKSVVGEVSRSEAYQTARELLRELPSQQMMADRVQPLRQQLSELEQRLHSQHNAQKSLDDFCKRIGQQVEADGLDEMLMTLEAQQESLSVSVSESGERRMEMRQQTEQLKQQIQSLTVKAPAWLAAQEALTQLCEQSHETFTSANDVTEYMQ
ncbi:chromosome partition protein MukB, partial [Klebsiella pneumoniae]|nr:chromosome partition protein MukB [Klebsiella pneumoniae]